LLLPPPPVLAPPGRTVFVVPPTNTVDTVPVPCGCGVDTTTSGGATNVPSVSRFQVLLDS
jgi:hypothetical protein